MIKTVGDLLSEASPESAETELLAMLDDAETAYKEALSLLAALRSKFVGNMSPQSKAANEIMGRKLGNEINKAIELKSEISRRLAVVARGQNRATIFKGVTELQRELETLRAHGRAVASGQVLLDEMNRRRLVHAISVAEMRVAEAKR